MDACEIVKKWKYRVLSWLLQGIEPEQLRWEFDVTTTMLHIIAVLQIIAMSYVTIRAENAVKFELQS